MWDWNDGTECLEHYGRLGMRWYVRNYQNYDGSLTPAGKIRYGSANGKSEIGSTTNLLNDMAIRGSSGEEVADAVRKSMNDLDAAKSSDGKSTDGILSKNKNSKQKNSQSKDKPISEMTDDEIKERIAELQKKKDRMDLENQLKTLEQAVAPKKTESFIVKTGKTFLKDKLAPALMETGKKYITQQIEEKLGLTQKDSLAKKAEEARNLSAIYDMKTKQFQLEKSRADRPDIAKSIDEKGQKSKADSSNAAKSTDEKENKSKKK